MRKHRRRIATFACAVLATASAGGPATALAVPDAAKYPRPVPAGQGQTPSELAQRVTSAPVGDTKSDLPQPASSAMRGDTKSDLPQPASSATLGDTKSDSPGATRAPKAEQPTTIQVVRPERTIVRDTDPVLPIVLASLALLVAVGAGGTALVRMRSLRLS
jgi:hypothetical protein